MARAIFVIAGGLVLAGCAGDEAFYASYCENLGHATDSNAFTICVDDKRVEIERERARRFRAGDIEIPN